MLCKSCDRGMIEKNVTETALQTTRSVKKEGEGVLYVLKQRFP